MIIIIIIFVFILDKDMVVHYYFLVQSIHCSVLNHMVSQEQEYQM